MSLAMRHFELQGVRMVAFDESQHIIEGHSKDTAYEAADVFKMLLNEARVQVVCVGLPRTLEILDANPQIPRHCTAVYELKPFAMEVEDLESDYMTFMRGLNAYLPFDESSNLHHPVLAMRIHLASDGLIGLIMHLVQTATARAIEEGLSCLTRKVLGEVYGEISIVKPADNPFISPEFNENMYEAIQARRKTMNKRRASASITCDFKK